MPALTQPSNRPLNEATGPAGQRKDPGHSPSHELASEETAIRRTCATLKPAQQLTSFLDWLRDVGVDRFDLALIRFGPETPEGCFIPGSADLDRAGVENSLAWLRYENSRTAGAYFRPARGHAWPLVFLDDVAPVDAKHLADNHSAALIETSPCRFHVWLAMDHALDEYDRYRVQASLAQQVGADMGSVSGEHWGRLPGFKNRKPGKDYWVNLRRLSVVQPYTISLSPGDTPVLPERHEDQRPRVVQQDKEQDESAVEWKYVRSALEAGVPPAIVDQRLLERCVSRRGSDARRYVERTMRKACAKGGIAFN